MFAECEPLSGFHAPERDPLGPFIWTEGSFRTRLKRAARFALIELCYYGDDGILSLSGPNGALDRITLARGWHECAVRLESASQGDELTWQLSPVIPVAGDTRELGLMVRRIELFDDERRYRMIAETEHNGRLNDREFRARATRLESFPPQVRITMEARCNIPETSQACVYCAWDWAKGAEVGSPAFTLDTLEAMGSFYHSAVEVVDCSYGEPAMNKDFGAIVAQLDRDGKALSLTSNGQLLSAKRRREVLGKNLRLYVSIDSATAAGYTRYRNDRFDDIITNLTALCREKKDYGDLPRVHVSFIMMRSNVDELSQFFALMHQVGVDEVKLRMLYLDENLPTTVTNNGYRFDYAHELLRLDELEALAPRARELAGEHGVSVYVEWEQFADDQTSAAGAPLCSEPWRTLYLLRRGIMPCCYATKPIATWDQQQGRPLEEFLGDVFNGPAYQTIRAELAAGRLADFCLQTPSCPILKRMQHEGRVDAPLNRLQRQMLAEPDEPALPWVPLANLTAAKHVA